MHFIKKIFKSLCYRCDLLVSRVRYDLNIGKIRNSNPHVLTCMETLERILQDKCSLARFGDGELYIMLGLDYSPFQKCTPELTADLLEIISYSAKGLLVGLPDTFDDVSRYESTSRRFWKSFMGKYRNKVVRSLPENYRDLTYANTNCTRFYSDLKSKSECIEIIAGFKKIWAGRPIICIEGEKTRLGVGNDLFDNAAEFKRILVPARNAHSKVNEVMQWIENNKETIVKEDTLFILAAGMAATVMACRLWESGYQALDLGHIDIQYEYYLRQARSKIAIPGKYTNENIAGRNPTDDFLDEDYFHSIIFTCLQ